MSFNKTDRPLHLGAKGKNFSNARNLRTASTEAEKALWNEIRNKKLKGFKFRRQHPFGRYIADFYCHEARLIIEVDGGIHKLSDCKEHDDGRTFELENHDIKVIRFTNREIMEDLDNVVKRIAMLIER